MTKSVSSGAERRALIFGARGAIGREIALKFSAEYTQVFIISRFMQYENRENFIPMEWSFEKPFKQSDFGLNAKIDAIVWAQGSNFNDDIYEFDLKNHLDLYNSNVAFVLESLNQLVRLDLVSQGARLCVISSIWQEIARQNKLSYTVTKSALKGLVRSLSIDLGSREILINAVLPGALDTPMTRKNLTRDQIKKIEQETPLNSLPTFSDVVGLTAFLCSTHNSGITGQFIAADRGYSFVRVI